LICVFLTALVEEVALRKANLLDDVSGAI